MSDPRIATRTSAYRAARDAWHAHYCGEDRSCTPGDRCAGAPDRPALQAALAAALPHLTPRPVCTCPTDADVTPGMRTETGQHLSGCLTLGGPTGEQIAEALHAHDQLRALIPLGWAQASYMTRHAYLGYADVVLALINGSRANG